MSKEVLTVPFKDIFKVNGVGDPLASQERFCETPNADIHGPSSRFWSEAGKVDGLPGEHVGLPALTFVCGEPETTIREQLWQRINTMGVPGNHSRCLIPNQRKPSYLDDSLLTDDYINF